jgi:hypothetical protein
MGRGSREDAAPAAGLHAWNGGPDGVEGGREIDGEDLVPLLGRKLLDGRDVLDAGVVDEDINGSERLLGLSHHGDDLVRLGHVGGQVDCCDAELSLQTGPLLLDLAWLAEAVDQDVRALLGQSARDAEPDAAGRASDNRGFGTKFHQNLRVAAGFPPDYSGCVITRMVTLIWILILLA